MRGAEREIPQHPQPFAYHQGANLCGVCLCVKIQPANLAGYVSKGGLLKPRTKVKRVP